MNNLFAVIGAFFGSAIGSYFARRWLDIREIIRIKTRLSVLEEKSNKGNNSNCKGICQDMCNGEWCT